MNKLVFLATMWLAACTALLVEPRSWAFVQAVGGISIGEPIRNDSAWLLPVRGDVSGTQGISTKPSQVNSGLTCYAVEANIEGSAIFVVMSTTVAGSRSAKCPPAVLGHPADGVYSVFYRAPNEAPIFLRDVRIGGQPELPTGGAEGPVLPPAGRGGT